MGMKTYLKQLRKSKVEAVAFCTYPGQSIAKKKGGGNYESFSGDLSSYDFSEWFNQGYDQQSHYGWLKSEMFSDKAKVVYEFEGFYNQSSYISRTCRFSTFIGGTSCCDVALQHDRLRSVQWRFSCVQFKNYTSQGCCIRSSVQDFSKYSDTTKLSYGISY